MRHIPHLVPIEVLLLTLRAFVYIRPIGRDNPVGRRYIGAAPEL